MNGILVLKISELESNRLELFDDKGICNPQVNKCVVM